MSLAYSAIVPVFNEEGNLSPLYERLNDAMKELKKTYDIVTYDGAGHGFMRAGESSAPPNPPAPKGDPDADKKADDAYAAMDTANRKARNDAWIRWKAILAKL